MSADLRAQVLVVGSGAGGATTAAKLAEAGYDVLIVEEGREVDTSLIRSNSLESLETLYRHGGLTPILGNNSIAFVEGCCVGGSTEINSGFWHRLPPDSYHRWRADYLLDDFSEAGMEATFEQLEAELTVSHIGAENESAASSVLRRGAERLDWAVEEVPRCQKRADQSAFAPGAKQSMQRTFIPRALAAGARLIADCKVLRLEIEDDRVVGIKALLGPPGRRVERRIRADFVFVCCGAVQTPALLRRSGVRHNVGESLRLHPMIKAAAVFEDEIEWQDAAIPMYQVKEFWPTLTLGGSVFTPGFLGMLASDNWQSYSEALDQIGHVGLYYAAVRGLERGRIRALPGTDEGTLINYGIGKADQRNLSEGLAHLGELLFEAGAKAVYPSLRGFPVLRSVDQCRAFAKQDIPIEAMSLSTVHAFSSCPMGENPGLCATDSFGRVAGMSNLYVNDASLLPDSPGVNPQGSTMAIATRNAERFIGLAERRGRSPRATREAAMPRVLITGGTGWLGTAFVHRIARGESCGFAAELGTTRCLVPPGYDGGALPERGDASAPALGLVPGDLRDAESLRAFCEGAEGATLFHIAGLIHPALRTSDFSAVNVEGTRSLLEAAANAGVKRVVAVSSNSPLGCNPHPEHRFDESSPYDPYMGYGKSKMEMERIVNEIGARGLVETVLIRAPWFYGPHQPPRQTQFFKMIKDGGFPLLGDGTQQRSMAYVENLADGLFLAAHTEAAAGQTYWIADERPYPINEIVDTVEDVLQNEFGIQCSGKRMRLPGFVGDLAQFADATLQALTFYEQRIHVLGEMNKTIACSIDRAKAELGYAPRFALREGMTASIRWCLENGQYI